VSGDVIKEDWRVVHQLSADLAAALGGDAVRVLRVWRDDQDGEGERFWLHHIKVFPDAQVLSAPGDLYGVRWVKGDTDDGEDVVFAGSRVPPYAYVLTSMAGAELKIRERGLGAQYVRALQQQIGSDDLFDLVTAPARARCLAATRAVLGVLPDVEADIRTICEQDVPGGSELQISWEDGPHERIGVVSLGRQDQVVELCRVMVSRRVYAVVVEWNGRRAHCHDRHAVETAFLAMWNDVGIKNGVARLWRQRDSCSVDRTAGV
jgi:hypothetical protein